MERGFTIQEVLELKEIPNENRVTWLDVMAYAGDPGTLEAEGGDIEVKSS